MGIHEDGCYVDWADWVGKKSNSAHVCLCVYFVYMCALVCLFAYIHVTLCYSFFGLHLSVCVCVVEEERSKAGREKRFICSSIFHSIFQTQPGFNNH